MIMHQHTPGPWTTDALYIYSGKVTIAKVYDMAEGVEVSPEQAASDAHLIAKAPEMLDMLASCLAYFDDMRNGGYAAATPDAAWTAPIRALLWDIEGESSAKIHSILEG